MAESSPNDGSEAADGGRSLLEELLAKALAEACPGLEQRMARDPEAYLELVAMAAEAQAGTTRMLADAVGSARAAGNSWAAIGRTLGLSKQAVQQRFGRSGDPADEDQAGNHAADTRVISPLTALDEMPVLNRLGKYGWRSVGFGTLYHRVSKTDLQWEHRRVYATHLFRRKPEAEGWERIGSLWFPWAYFARCTGQPALPEPAEAAFWTNPDREG